MKTKQKLILTIIAVPILIMLVYCIFAFAQWNFNAGEWSETARVFTIITSLASSAFLIVGIMSISNKN